MKPRKVLMIGIVIGMAISLCMAFTYTLDCASPLGTDAPSTIDDKIRETRYGYQERLNVDHIFDLTGTSLSGTYTGYHRDIHLYSTTGTSPIIDFVTTGGIDELRYTDSGGNDTQLTSSGGFNLALLTSQTITTPTLTSPVFNTGVSGTAVLDEDNMASDSATKLATQQSIKAYVDSRGVVQQVYSETGAVATGSTVFPVDDTIPQSTEGDQYLSKAITPTSATNLLKIEVIVNISAALGDTGGMAIFQDATANALAAMVLTLTASYGNTFVMTHWMTAGTTSATTFKVRIGTANGRTITLNGVGGARKFGGVCASSITITEYVP